MPSSSVTATFGPSSPASARASHSTLPTSREMSCASSSLRSAASVANRCAITARFSNPRSRHAGNASRAAATAVSTAAASATGNTPDLIVRIRGRHTAQRRHRTHGSGVTLTASPASTPSTSRASWETKGDPVRAHRHDRRPEAERAFGGEERERQVRIRVAAAHLARQHQRAPLGDAGDRIARRTVVGPAIERVHLVEIPEPDLLEDAQRRHGRCVRLPDHVLHLLGKQPHVHRIPRKQIRDELLVARREVVPPRGTASA